MAFAVLTASGCAATPDRVAARSAVDDRAITSAIQSRHAQSPDVASRAISVETLYGVVLLSGSAGSPQEKAAAERIAMQVNGVKAVRNEILVQP